MKFSTVAIHHICFGKGLSNTPEIALELLQSVLSETIDLICAKYPTVESCWEQQPKVMKELEDAILNRIIRVRPMTTFSFLSWRWSIGSTKNLAFRMSSRNFLETIEITRYSQSSFLLVVRVYLLGPHCGRYGGVASI